MKKTYLLFLLTSLLMASCQMKEKQLENIFNQENADNASTPESIKDLARSYEEYAKSYPSDTLSSQFIYKGQLNLNAIEEHERSIEFSDLYLKLSAGKSLNDSSFLYRARSFHHLGSTDSAIASFERFQDNNILSKEDLNSLAIDYLKHIELNPTSDMQADYSLKAGNILFSRGNMDAALNLFKSHRQKDPNSQYAPYAMMREVDIYEAKGELDSARNVLTEIISNYPDDQFARDAQTFLDKDLLGKTDEEKFQIIVGSK